MREFINTLRAAFGLEDLPEKSSKSTSAKMDPPEPWSDPPKTKPKSPPGGKPEGPPNVSIGSRWCTISSTKKKQKRVRDSGELDNDLFFEQERLDREYRKMNDDIEREMRQLDEELKDLDKELASVFDFSSMFNGIGEKISDVIMKVKITGSDPWEQQELTRRWENYKEVKRFLDGKYNTQGRETHRTANRAAVEKTLRNPERSKKNKNKK